MIGKTVGHYRLTAKLGAGGMGEVFLAEDTRLERKAAIKFLPAEWAGDPGRRQRFLTEAKAASALNHPHVCVVYDVGPSPTRLEHVTENTEVQFDGCQMVLQQANVEGGENPQPHQSAED